MRSIRRDMAILIGGATAILLLGGGAGLHLTLREALTTQFDNALATKAEALVTASEIDNEEFEIDLDIQAFAGFGVQSPGDYFEIYNTKGLPIRRSPSLGSSHLSPPADFSTKARGFSAITLPDGASGRAYWETYTPADDLENQFSDLRLLVASNTSTLRRTLRTVALVILAFGGGAILACLGVMHHVVGAAMRPLDRLSAEVQRIDAQQLSQGLAVDDLPVELQGVASKLNELLARLEISFARERRFTSDAAHELRTPLAELRAMTELAATWPRDFTSEDGLEMLAALGELETLLDKLSLLAKTDSAATPGLEPVDLEESLRDCVDRIAEDTARRNIRITLSVEPGPFATDPVLWRAVVSNLVGNAVAYAPEGGEVRIAASPRSLTVENEAPDLEAGDVERLFERFWRKSPSRTEKGHSGLGLSVVRAAVAFLGGSCGATLNDGLLRIEARWSDPASAALPATAVT